MQRLGLTNETTSRFEALGSFVETEVGLSDQRSTDETI
jgi:hypothetical protein